MQKLLDQFRPGETVYLPGATGEITALADALAAEPERMRDVHVLSCLLPGLNAFDYAALHDTARITTFLLPPALRASFEAGKVRILPIAYSAIALHIGRIAKIDTAFAHVSQPDAHGRCSFGIAADFSLLAWRRARRRVALVNPLMPAMKRGPRIHLAEADIIVECQSPLVEVAANAPSPELRSIARAVAAMIPDNATLQFGLGGAPGAVSAELTSHRGLRIKSGMATEGARALAESGALASPGEHCVGIACGTAAFYEYLSESDLIGFQDSQTTHDSAALARICRFHAINAAFEVDLLGQVNLEWQNGRLASGVGGAPDFARAATGSTGGRSLTLLPSTAGGGSVSRIVARLDSPTSSLARSDIGTIITEHGIAELRGLSLDERANALIAVAGHQHRDALANAWHEMRKRF